MTRLQAFAVQPISRSKSSIGVPALLSLAFSFAKMSIETSNGITFTSDRKSFRIFKFCSLLLEHSTPNFSSATVTSEI